MNDKLNKMVSFHVCRTAFKWLPVKSLYSVVNHKLGNFFPLYGPEVVFEYPCNPLSSINPGTINGMDTVCALRFSAPLPLPPPFLSLGNFPRGPPKGRSLHILNWSVCPEVIELIVGMMPFRKRPLVPDPFYNRFPKLPKHTRRVGVVYEFTTSDKLDEIGEHARNEEGIEGTR